LISPFSESKIAKGLVYSISERMIIITTVKGTLTIIPVVPQINPQNIKDRMLTKGLIFIEFPIHFGSIKFPITTWMDPTTKRIIRAIEKSPNCNKENTTGNNVANKEPMVGMKFRRNIRNAQKIAKLRSQK
jgi:hypothetical protein